ncbi:hypothetical protein [Stackebrandtia soli]|uniref:hypothetical protein n=1 Tax=Stackebrandtia soli TaxID=1892856 RepID=UPI0039E8FA93
MDFVTSALIVSWVAILLLALVVSGLIRQVHQLSKGVIQQPLRAGIQPGATAPDVTELLDGGGVLLFLSPGCRSCAEALDETATWLATTDGTPRARAVYSGPAPADTPVPAIGDRADLFERYDAIATPFAVVIDDAGVVVRSEPVGSRSAARDLLTSMQPSPSRSSS